MRDKTAKDNRQRGLDLFSHDFTQNNLLAFFIYGKSSILTFSDTEIVLCFISDLMYKQIIINMNDILPKSNDQTRLDNASESKTIAFMISFRPRSLFA